MATITEDFVSFETAKLLKEKGFDECIFEFYEGNKIKYARNGKGFRLSELGSDIYYPHITLQMAMKWLREVHDHIIEIHYGNVGSPREPEIQWWWELENKQGEFLEGNITDGNTTYEGACEAAIKYCLENLI